MKQIVNMLRLFLNHYGLLVSFITVRYSTAYNEDPHEQIIFVIMSIIRMN